MKGEVDIMVNFPIDTFLKTIAHSAMMMTKLMFLKSQPVHFKQGLHLLLSWDRWLHSVINLAPMMSLKNI